jgi:hypothetical protein
MITIWKENERVHGMNTKKGNIWEDKNVWKQGWKESVKEIRREKESNKKVKNARDIDRKVRRE